MTIHFVSWRHFGRQLHLQVSDTLLLPHTLVLLDIAIERSCVSLCMCLCLCIIKFPTLIESIRLVQDAVASWCKAQYNV